MSIMSDYMMQGCLLGAQGTGDKAQVTKVTVGPDVKCDNAG